jgi:hypothetical protein
MIDPRSFISSSESGPPPKYRTMQGSFSCSEQGCYEVATEGEYDEENRKIFWTCPNGHEGSARL